MTIRMDSLTHQERVGADAGWEPVDEIHHRHGDRVCGDGSFRIFGASCFSSLDRIQEAELNLDV